MKKIVFIVSIFALVSFDKITPKQHTQQTKLKRYEVQSAIVTYKTDISGGMLGSHVTGSGEEHLYFKDWGNIELKESESSQTTKSKLFGHEKTNTTHTHTMNKLVNGKSYMVDFEQKIIRLSRDAAMEMTQTFAGGDAHKTGKQILEDMGGHIVGQGEVLGYHCDIWEVMGGKQWIYKGLPLKVEVHMMGITTTTVATQAQFNVDVPDHYFQLPDFPIQEMEGYENDEEYARNQKNMKKSAAKMHHMSYAQYKAMLLKNDPEASKMTEKEMKESYKMFQMMTQKMR